MSRSRVIMSCMTAVHDFKFARFVLLGVSEEAKKMTLIFFRSMYNKTIILDITKTSSNNCL